MSKGRFRQAFTINPNCTAGSLALHATTYVGINPARKAIYRALEVRERTASNRHRFERRIS